MNATIAAGSWISRQPETAASLRRLDNRFMPFTHNTDMMISPILSLLLFCCTSPHTVRAFCCNYGKTQETSGRLLIKLNYVYTPLFSLPSLPSSLHSPFLSFSLQLNLVQKSFARLQTAKVSLVSTGLRINKVLQFR